MSSQVLIWTLAVLLAFLLIVDQLWEREGFPRPLRYLGHALFGSFSRSVATFASFLLLLLIAASLSSHLPQDPLLLAFDFFVGLCIVASLEYFKWFAVSSKPAEEVPGDHIVGIAEWWAEEGRDVKHYLTLVVQQFEDNPLRKGYDDYLASKQRLLTRDDDIGRMFREALEEQEHAV